MYEFMNKNKQYTKKKVLVLVFYFKTRKWMGCYKGSLCRLSYWIDQLNILNQWRTKFYFCIMRLFFSWFALVYIKTCFFWFYFVKLNSQRCILPFPSTSYNFSLIIFREKKREGSIEIQRINNKNCSNRQFPS